MWLKTDNINRLHTNMRQRRAGRLFNTFIICSHRLRYNRACLLDSTPTVEVGSASIQATKRSTSLVVSGSDDVHDKDDD